MAKNLVNHGSPADHGHHAGRRTEEGGKPMTETIVLQRIRDLQYWLDGEQNDFAHDLAAELGSSHPLARRYHPMLKLQRDLPFMADQAEDACCDNPLH